MIGGLVGAGVARSGFKAVVWSGFMKTTGAIVLSPLLGFVLALVLVAAVSWIFIRSTPFAVGKLFRTLQFGSAALYSLGHGGNDAQKTMGIIAVLLYSQGYMPTGFHVPLWVVLSCQAAMALGTLLGGWRIVHTMGSKITRLSPMRGFCAETGGALTLFLATWLGVPGLYDAHDHRGDCRRWRSAWDVSGALEYCPKHCGRVDAHTTGDSAYCRRSVWIGPFFPLTVKGSFCLPQRRRALRMR